MEHTTAPSPATTTRGLAHVEAQGATRKDPIRRLLALHGVIGNQVFGVLLRSGYARTSGAPGAHVHVQRKLPQANEANLERLRADKTLDPVRSALIVYFIAGEDPDSESGPLFLLREACATWLGSGQPDKLANDSDDSRKALPAFVKELHAAADNEYQRLEKLPRTRGLQAQDIPPTRAEQVAMEAIEDRHLAQTTIEDLIIQSAVGPFVDKQKFPRIKRAIHETPESFAAVYVNQGMAIFKRDHPNSEDDETQAERDRLTKAANGTEALTIEDTKSRDQVIHLQRKVGDRVTAIHETMHALTSAQFKGSPYFSVNLNEGLAEAMAQRVAMDHGLSTAGAYATELAPVNAAVERVGLKVVAGLYFRNEIDGFIAAFDGIAGIGAAARWFELMRELPSQATQMLKSPAPAAPAAAAPAP